MGGVVMADIARPPLPLVGCSRFGYFKSGKCSVSRHAPRRVHHFPRRVLLAGDGIFLLLVSCNPSPHYRAGDPVFGTVLFGKFVG